MSEHNYWNRTRRNRLSRRTLLQASGRAGVGAAGLALVGCGDDDDDAPAAAAATQSAEDQAQAQAEQAEPEEQAAPAAGATDTNATVRTLIGTLSGGLDPIRAMGPQTVMHFDKLGQYDPVTKEFVANAATFEWVDDYTGAIVELKPGLVFHDGEPMTAEDAKFSYDRYRGPDSLYGWMMGAVQPDGEITVEGERSIRLPLKTDASAFGLVGTEVRMQPKHIIEEIGQDAYHAGPGLVAGGPFRMESYVDGDRMVSHRFEDYHTEGTGIRQHKPYIKTMEHIVRPEPAARVAALLADEGDMTLSLGWDLAQIFKDSDDFNVLMAQGTDNWNIVMNTERPADDGTFPFRDIRVRRAVNHAVNFQAIIDSRGGHERRNIGIAAENIGALTEKQRAELMYEYDPEKARALMADAGYADGFRVPFWGYNSRFAGIAEGGQAIAQDLEAIGIRTDFQADEHAVFRPRLGAKGEDGIHEAAGFHHYFFNTYPDPAGNINAWIDKDGSISHSKADPGSKIQSLVEATKAPAAFDPEVRAKAINDLQVAISDEAMFLFGIQQINIGVMRKNLEWKEFGNRQDEFNFWGIRPIIT